MNKFSKADLHIHTQESKDAFSTPFKILKYLKNKTDIKITAITDHNTLKGAEEALSLASYFDLEVIKGEEIDTKEGHLLGLFLEEEIKPFYSAKEVISEIHRQGGLVIIPHPNGLLNSFSTSDILKVMEEIEGIEIQNPTWIARIGRMKNHSFNLGGLAEVGGSDAHLLSHIGKSYTIFKGEGKEELRSSIKKGLTLMAGENWNFTDHFFYLTNYIKNGLSYSVKTKIVQKLALIKEILKYDI